MVHSIGPRQAARQIRVLSCEILVAKATRDRPQAREREAGAVIRIELFKNMAAKIISAF
jgi:hypothetical protein